MVITSIAVDRVVLRIVLAWKNAQMSEARMLRLRASVFALFPSIPENARNKAMIAIRRAIFLLTPAACCACSACSNPSCASGMAPPALWPQTYVGRCLCRARGDEGDFLAKGFLAGGARR